MIVCSCEVVTDRDVAVSVAAGAGTLAQVCRDTSAGRSCGRCVPTLKALLCQHCPLRASARLEVADAPG
jgi:NAD(P)H-nitrite reductase large subunit